MQQLCSKHAARVVQRTPRQALHLAHLLAPVVSRAATGDRQMSPANSTHGSCSTAERNAPADSRAGDLDHGVRGVSHEWHWHLSHLHLWPGGSVIYSVILLACRRAGRPLRVARQRRFLVDCLGMRKGIIGVGRRARERIGCVAHGEVAQRRASSCAQRAAQP